MTEKGLVIQHVQERMMDAFLKGDLDDARNMEKFISCLEGMTDDEFEEIAAEECPGAIS